jgi:hypothetical protein
MTTAATTRGYSTSNECKLENRGGIQRVESGLFDGEDCPVTGQFCVEFFLVIWSIRVIISDWVSFEFEHIKQFQMDQANLSVETYFAIINMTIIAG